MRKFVKLALAVSGLGLVGATSGCASMHKDHAQKLSTSDVPARVMDPVRARFPGAQVTSVEREKENGQIIYDFELTQNGRKYESDVRDDGTIVEIEKQVNLTDVPPAVTRGVHDKYANATITEVMEVNKVNGRQETPDHYEVVLSTGGGGAKDKEVNVSMDGKVTEESGDEK